MLKSVGDIFRPRVPSLQELSYYSTKGNVPVATEPNSGQMEVQPAAGTPNSIINRTVYIYPPSRSVTQSGILHADTWRIDFDVQARWENPLIGWTSSRDPMQAVCLKFPAKEDAIRFATRQGWNYQIEQPKETKWRSKSYADNFTYSANRLKLMRTK